VNGNYKAEEKRLWNRKREKVMLENIKASIVKVVRQLA
jgi:hypothetical protein